MRCSIDFLFGEPTLWLKKFHILIVECKSEKHYLLMADAAYDQLRGVNVTHILQLAGQHLSGIGLDIIIMRIK
jgi:hypothetical protein